MQNLFKTFNFSGKRILIIDDDETSLILFNEVLSFVGAYSETALEEEEAIRKYNILKPHLVLLDLLFPGCSGVEIARQIRYINSDAFIIAITACYDDGTKEPGEELFNDILRKPIDFKILLETINKYLSPLPIS